MKSLLAQVYGIRRQGLEDRKAARTLGVPVKEYRRLLHELDGVEDAIRASYHDLSTQKDLYISELEDSLAYALEADGTTVLEYEENLEKGTGRIKVLASHEPRSPEEVETLVKIKDHPRWKLSHYYNKQQPGTGMWVVTAMITQRGEGQLSPEEITRTIQKVLFQAPIESFRTYPTVNNEKALFIYTADKHIAAKVDGARAMFRNHYDGLEFRTRMRLVLNEVHYLQGMFGTFRDIYVIDLGDKMDGLDGMTTRKGHRLPQNMSNREAFETALSVEKEFCDLLFTSGCASQYHLVQNCNSNHGGDFEYMTCRALEEYINVRYPDVKTRNLQKFIEHVDYGRHTVLLTHGKDDEDLKHGLPRHLNDKTENFLNKYLMFHGIDPERAQVSVVKADLHTNNSEDAYGFRYRNVLSLFGGSKWVGNNFGPSKPGCSFDIYEQQSDRVYEHRIFFGS